MTNIIPFGKRTIPLSEALTTLAELPETISFDSFYQHLVTDAAENFSLESVSGSRWTELRFTLADADAGKALSAADWMATAIRRRYGRAERRAAGFSSEWRYTMEKKGSANLHQYENEDLQIRLIFTVQRTKIKK